MKIALISDTHFGDPYSTLIEKKDSGYVKGPKYNDFLNAAGTGNDYLILLGDIFDFSITSYKDAYEAGRAFFSQIQKDNIAEEYIYIPGNHDNDIWHIVEHEVNIIYQIKTGDTPKQFKMSVPGVIDDRAGSAAPGFTLPGVTKQKGKYPYGGLFLDYLTKTSGSRKLSRFTFVYPNLYMVTDTDSVIISHGHYMEFYWNLLIEWAPEIFGEDLRIDDSIDIAELVGINFPLNQLACSGVGQAGALSQVLSDLQQQIKMGEYKKVITYLNNFDNELDKRVFNYPKLSINEAATDIVSNFLKSKIIKAISEFRDSRYNEDFLHKPEVRERLNLYYNASCVEIDNLKRQYNIDIPVPRTIIFGHTHQPIPWNYKQAPKAQPSSQVVVRLYNSGGWIWKYSAGVKQFCGAEVFKYESGKGFSSVTIN